MGGNLLTVVFYLVILTFGLKWVFQTVNSLPGDLAQLREYREQGRMDFFWPELGVMVFYWVLSVVFLLLILLPIIFKVFTGFGLLPEFISGFRI